MNKKEFIKNIKIINDEFFAGTSNTYINIETKDSATIRVYLPDKYIDTKEAAEKAFDHFNKKSEKDMDSNETKGAFKAYRELDDKAEEMFSIFTKFALSFNEKTTAEVFIKHNRLDIEQ